MMKNGALAIPVERVQQAIYLVRGQKVMLDKDLAQLYRVETRVLNQAVRRNAERFPSDFMFKLTRDEVLRISQFVISSDLKFSKNVYAFTQEGVAMLSGGAAQCPRLAGEHCHRAGLCAPSRDVDLQ